MPLRRLPLALPAAYADPAFRQHLFGGIYWAATGRLNQGEKH
jgi:hypothetical protein